VEDEPAVRRLLKKILCAHGYQVIEAGSPAEALAVADRPDTRPDILVTDVIMPEMNGRVLHDRLRARLPDLPVLYVSGYSEDVLARSGILEPGIRLLPKPFRSLALTQMVRDALDAGRAPGAASKS
jgi:two-component system, cell cycle sensor histidine kinase and response regulator CckA